MPNLSWFIWDLKLRELCYIQKMWKLCMQLTHADFMLGSGFRGNKEKCIFFCFVGICFIFDNNISVNTFFVAENTIFFYFALGAYLYSLLVTSRSIFTLDMVFSRCQFWKLPSQRGTIYRIVCLSQKHGYVISSVDRVKVL